MHRRRLIVMLMGFLSALGIAGNLIHDYFSRNEGTNECNKYIARYGRQRGLYEYNFLRGLSLDNRIERLADMFFYGMPRVKKLFQKSENSENQSTSMGICSADPAF